MEDILEFVISVVGQAIYGTDDKPRHPFWRNAVRTIAFSGVFISASSFLGLLNDVTFPIIPIILWGLCAMIVISAEYYVGSKKVCYAALTVFAIWLIALLTGAGVL